jgi:hypothetical protein
MKKKIISWELKNKLWEKWESFYLIEDHNNSEYLKNLTFESLGDEVFPKDVEQWIKELALNRFKFELHFVMRKPIESLKWLYGEHAMLYDVFGCDKHKWTCVTHDDCDRYIEGLTVFCPECNKDIFMNEEKRKEYESLVEGEFFTDDNWKKVMELSKWTKKWNRRQNFKYALKEWTRKGYVIYRIKRMLGLYNKKKTATP